MSDRDLRCPAPSGLVRPVPVDPDGRTGPTTGQARGPFWRRSSPRLYVPAGADRDIVEQRILEESMRLPAGGAVTGWAALRLAGAGFLDGVAPDGCTVLDVPLLLPPGRDIRRGAGFTVRRERIDDRELTAFHGIPCTVPLRAVFDEVRGLEDLRERVVVIDMAVGARLIQLPVLTAYVANKAGWPHVRRALAALPLADVRSRSPQETRLRLIRVLDAGLPRPRCNWPIADAHGVFIGKPDLLCEELAVVGEFDGVEHRSRRRHQIDVRRDDRFRRAGLECFHVVGADLTEVPLVVDRIRAAVERAGTSGIPRAWRVRRDPGPV